MNRLNLEDYTYFVTSITYKRRELFTDPKLAKIVLDQWEHYQDLYNFDLKAYCIMPDHYHALIHPGGDKDLSDILYAVHSYSAKLINENMDEDGQKKIWQGNAFDEVIRSEDTFYQKLAYILFNPWRASLVKDPFDRYDFSNLGEWVDEEGQEFVEDLFSKYKRWAE